MDKTIEFAGEQYHLEYQNVKYKGPYYHKDALEILFIMRGEVTIEIEDESTILRNGDFISINAGLSHTLYGDEHSYIISLYFDLEYYKKRYPYIRGFSFYAKYCGESTKDLEHYQALRNYLIRLMLVESLEIPKQNKISAEICDLILNILINHIYDEVFLKNRLSDLKLNDRERLLSLALFISNNYNKRGLTLTELAEHEHLSPTRLSHFWKSMTNMSFMDAINYARFMHAKRLLMQGGMSVKNIVKECGYSDEKYLYKVFREKYDMTPVEFMKKHCETLLKPGEYTVKSLTEIKAEMIEYIANYYSKLNDFTFLDEVPHKIEEEKKLNDLYSIITTTYKKKMLGEDTYDDHTLLKLELNSGLRTVDGKIDISWEYIYAMELISIVLHEKCAVTIDVGLMSINEWNTVIKKIMEKIYEMRGNDYISTTSLYVTYRGYENYSKAHTILKNIEKLNFFADLRTIKYI